MKSARNRAIGIETEWAVTVPTATGKYDLLQGDKVDSIVKNCMPDGIIASKGNMTSYGGRLYAESLGFIETASAETTVLEDAIAVDIASEHLVTMMLAKAVDKRFIKPVTITKVDADGEEYEKTLPPFRVNKRVMDDRGQTWGHHVSVSIDKSVSIGSSRLRPLAMHLATHNIFAGAGGVWRHGEYEGKNAAFAIGQKVCNLNLDYANASHGTTQPLVSLRGEHHSDSLKRLHVSTVDNNMSKWAMFMKYGTLSIIARLIEDGYTGEDLRLGGSLSMHEYAKKVALDPSLKAAEPAEQNGKMLRALDVQWHLFRKAEQLLLSDQEMLVMPEWKRALEDLETDPALLLDYRADWVLKKRILDRKMERHDIPLWHEDVGIAERAHDDLDPEISYGLRMRDREPERPWAPSTRRVHHLTYHPPETTRALQRGRLIRDNAADPELYANWMSVKVPLSKRNYHFDSPLQLDPEVKHIDAA